MVEFYRKMFGTMVENGIPSIIVETVPALAECDAILQALNEFDISAVVSFSCKVGFISGA